VDSTIKRILGIAEHDEPDRGKLAQETVMYLKPDLIKNEDGAHCGGCVFFKTGSSECVLTSPAKCDAEHGVCEAFLGRPPGKEIESDLLGLIPKTEAGYIEEGPTRCGLCEYWQGDEHAKGNVTSTCAKVKGTISASGCCNAWKEC
jgi:hypothetical protein